MFKKKKKLTSQSKYAYKDAYLKTKINRVFPHGQDAQDQLQKKTAGCYRLYELCQ